PRLVDVPVAVGQLVAGALVEGAEDRPVVRVVVLDDLEGPAVGDDVAADQVAVEVVGEPGVTGLAEELDGVLQQQVGLAGVLVEAVELAARLLDGLEGLGELAEALHRRVVQVGPAAVGAHGPILRSPAGPRWATAAGSAP